MSSEEDYSYFEYLKYYKPEPLYIKNKFVPAEFYHGRTVRLSKAYNANKKVEEILRLDRAAKMLDKLEKEIEKSTPKYIAHEVYQKAYEKAWITLKKTGDLRKAIEEYKHNLRFKTIDIVDDLLARLQASNETVKQVKQLIEKISENAPSLLVGRRDYLVLALYFYVTKNGAKPKSPEVKEAAKKLGVKISVMAFLKKYNRLLTILTRLPK